MTTSTPEPGLDLSSPVPVLLPGIGPAWPVWPALAEDELRHRHGERPVLAEELTGREVRLPLRELLDELHAPQPRGLYLRHQLLSRFDPRLWALVPREVRRHNWLAALPPELRPDWAWLMIGARGTSTPLHVDLMASSAWNLLRSGRKRWRFHPPARAESWGLLPPGCHPPGAAAGGQVEFVQRPGDLVVTPSGWAHEVHNLTGTVSITANFVNHSNLGFALRYFELTGDTPNLEALTAIRDAFSEALGR